MYLECDSLGGVFMVHILYNYYEYLSTKYSEATKETYLYNVNLFLKYLKENGRI